MIGAKERETRTLTRDCPVIEIPAGTPQILHAGSDVVVMQKLGGMYTVYDNTGRLLRIDGKDADALGLVVEIPVGARASSDQTIDEQVWAVLKTCFDPEIPVDIVELGLVYKCEVTELVPGQHRVYIRMTLTAPGCGMGDVIKQDVERKVRQIPGVTETEVELTFDPIWEQSMMSEAARLQLGMY